MKLFERHAQVRASFRDLDAAKIRKIFPLLDASVERLERIQGYVYKDKNVPRVALIHRSALVHWPVDKTGVFSNERLEYLGDAYLSFFVAVEAMIAHPSWQEGELSKLRAAVVGTDNLSAKTRLLGIGEILLLGKGESSQTGPRQNSILADAFESVTAALLLDGGEEVAHAWLSKIFAGDLILGGEILKAFDSKSRFQQWVQSLVGAPPTYRVVGTESTPERSEFIVAGFIGEVEIARASAPNKRVASKLVAEKMLALVDTGALTAEKVKTYFDGSLPSK